MEGSAPLALPWYPTAPRHHRGSDGYEWALSASDVPLLAQPRGGETRRACARLDVGVLHEDGEAVDRETRCACARLDVDDEAVDRPTPTLWVGTGVRPSEHPGTTSVTYGSGHLVPAECACCGGAGSTLVVFARTMKWKSSYGLGYYGYTQEYELCCPRCPSAGGASARYTARYKVDTAPMDYGESSFFEVLERGGRRTVVAKAQQQQQGGGGSGGRVAGAGGAAAVQSARQNAAERRAAARAARPQGRSGAPDGRKCGVEGCKRCSVRGTPYCMRHKQSARERQG